MKWLRANVASHGGDPRRISLIGQSAGATHVAGYVAHSRFHGRDGVGIAGALLISGVYDVSRSDPNPFQRAYYGDAQEKWAACSTLDGLVATRLPLLFSVSEFDGGDFQRQAAFCGDGVSPMRTGRFPRLHWLGGSQSSLTRVGCRVAAGQPRAAHPGFLSRRPAARSASAANTFEELRMVEPVRFPDVELYRGWGAPMRTECEIRGLESTQGAIPKGFAGALYKVGADRQYPSGRTDDIFIDGEGMIHMFRFKDDQVDYVSRWVHTERYKPTTSREAQPVRPLP